LTRLDFHGIEDNGAILLDNVSLTAVSGVPEPASILLAGVGLMMVGLVGKGLKRSAQLSIKVRRIVSPGTRRD
jgi:hypothetical protein